MNEAILPQIGVPLSDSRGAPSLLIVLTSDGIVHTVSRNGSEQSLGAIVPLPGTNLYSLVHPTDRTALQELCHALGSYDGPVTYILRLQANPSSEIWVEAIFDLLQNLPPLQPPRILCAVHPITAGDTLPEAESRQAKGGVPFFKSLCYHAMYMLDLEGNIISWNKGAQKIKGYVAEEVIGANFSIFYTSDDVAKGVPRQLLDLASLKGQYHVKGWRVRKDGSKFLAYIAIYSMYDEQCKIAGYTKIILDKPHRIDRKNASPAESLSESEILRRGTEDTTTLLEASRLMVMAENLAQVGHWRLDTQTQALFWSVEVYRAMGIPINVKPSLEDAFLSYHPCDRQMVERYIYDAIEFDRPFHFEARVIRPNGDIRDVLVSGQTEFDSMGNTIAIFGVFQDITSTRNAQREQERLIERYNIATTAAKVGIWEWDIETGAMSWDPIMFELYGLTNSILPLTYSTWQKAIHPDDRAVTEAKIAHAAKTGDEFEDEFRIVWPNGNIRHIRTQAHVVHDRFGTHRRMIGTNLNVTEVRMQAEALLNEKKRLMGTLDKLMAAKQNAEHSNRAKSDFLANMSHEIRTPLNGMLGLTDLLLETEITNDQKHLLTLLSEASQSLMVIINDILDISKIESGTLQIEEDIFSPEVLINAVVSIVYEMVNSKKITLTSKVSPDVPQWIIGDQNRLRQIVINLVTNAVKFTNEGSIHINLNVDSGEKKMLVFEVSDTGIGISAENQHLLFQNFSQIDPSAARKYGGTGLGLAICKRLVEAMAGTIGLRSEVDVGSTFYFSIRLVPSLAPKKDSLCSHVPLMEKYHVLLVEDNAINQVVARRMLEKIGHTVVLAVNGAEAVEKVKNEMFDIILMDMQMPIMDGITATRNIRRLAQPFCQTPIIALTANAMGDQIVQCREAGMNAHIAKPIDFNLLREAMHRLAGTLVESSKDGEMPDVELGIDELTQLFDGDHTNVIHVLQAALTSIKKDSELIEQALAKGDIAEVSEAAHRLKGTSSSIKAIKLCEMGHEIQEATRHSPVILPPTLLPKMQTIVGEVEHKIHRYISERTNQK